MREILFRGKRADNGEWVEGDLLNYLGWGKVHIAQNFKGAGGQEVLPETVGQYTGLCDKNGKKIFEGDIIKTDSGRRKAKTVVKYGAFKPKMFFDLFEKFIGTRPKEMLYGLFATSIRTDEEVFLSDNSNLIEVIGNIHDNPEQLKEGAE